MGGNFNKVKGFTSLLLLFFIATSAFQCEPEKSPEFVNMSFIIPIKIHPDVEEIHVKDTLWIDGVFPDSLLEFYTNKYYHFPDFDFKSRICIQKLQNPAEYLSIQPGALDKFNIVSKVGDFNSGTSMCSYLLFSYSQNQYLYKIGLIPSSTGIFSLNFLWPIDLHGIPEEQIDLTTVIDLGVTPDGRKRIPLYEAFYFLINDGDNNFDLFKENCKAASTETPTNINVFYEQKGGFAFRVVE